MEARKIIITGGATRMGAAIARKLSGPNKEILIHYNKSKLKAEKLKKELSNKGTKVYLVKGDLSKENDVNKIVKFAKSKLKYFDCLINNASLFENDKLENFTTDSWGQHLRTNLRTPALLSKEFAKNVRKGNNNIINIIDQRVFKLTPYFFSFFAHYIWCLPVKILTTINSQNLTSNRYIFNKKVNSITYLFDTNLSF